MFRVKKQTWLRKFIFFAFLFFQLPQLRAQTIGYTLTAGYSSNLTHHPDVSRWKNDYHIKARYYEKRKIFVYGAGIQYSSYQIIWRNYNVKKANFADISPFLLAGVQLETKHIKFNPTLQFGYSVFINQIPSYLGDEGGLFLSPNMDINFRLAQHLLLGINFGYQFTESKFDVKYQDQDNTIAQNFIADDYFTAFSSGINLTLIF